ncbi:MAG: N-carbamoylputrescine amidase [Phyllobacteriaceae bacterium]|nr:N-carbamoylputrescine amidase [Phyllobacteriaceae bacterium]
MTALIAAAVQIACTNATEANLDRLEARIGEAASRGAGLVVLQELFEAPYFCQDMDERWFAAARPFDDHAGIARFRALAKRLGVVLPYSWYERDGDRLFNSLAMIDADGRVVGRYRKSHIPDSHGYYEKYYFSPGDTGFMVHETAVGRVGAGICWDQWFPEAARAMVLMGADVLVYPTAIGSEPSTPGWDSRDHWQRVMQGHAGANLTPVIAANRIGVEKGRAGEMTFYGSSFIADFTGRKVAEAGRVDEEVIVANLDLDAMREARRSWGVFRDRRPELYGALTGPKPRALDCPNVSNPAR